MARLPLALRPSFIIRSNALSKGVLGPSTLWKFVALVMFGRGTVKRLFGRTPERLAVRRIRPGHVITVATSAPLTRRQAKRAGISKSLLAAAARADLEAAQRAS